MGSSLALLHTTIETVKPARALAARTMPTVKPFNIVDDGFLPLFATGPTPSTVKRLRVYLEQARDAGAAGVLCCCSSLGAIASALTDPPLPFWRLHDAAVDAALERGAIGVLATAEKPLNALTALLEERRGTRTPRVIARIAKGAFPALIAGREQEHDDLVLGALDELGRECDVVILAQLTIERVLARLQPPLADRVLSSGELGFARTARLLADQEAT
jgi:hypothetical protein